MRKKWFELLKYIQENPGSRYIDVLNAFDPVNQAVSTDRDLKELVRRGYLRIPHGSSPPDCPVQLTSSGYAALEEFEVYADQDTNDHPRKDANHEVQRLQTTEDRRKLFKRDIAVAVIASTISGLILLAIQNWSAIISFLVILFQ